jgi:uncharacterized protein YfaS (alpha-2-macroglobulin family)/outer membrane protein assembly factor BamD (BamD/ComL family)
MPRFVIASLLFWLAASAVAVSQPPAEEAPAKKAPPAITSLPKIDPAIHEALQSREFDAAVKAIDSALGKPDVVAADYLHYLKARALVELNKVDEALAVYGQIEEKFPNGEWVSRSKFGRADILVRARNYQAAGQLYRAEAERLLSRGRKDQLAGIYLEFADRYFEGVPAKDPSQEKKPDYQQALTYYQEALKLGPTRGLRQKMEFRIARSFQELGNHGEAIGAYERFLRDHGDEKIPVAERASVEMISQARYELGVVQLAAGQPSPARKTWKVLIDEAAKPSDKRIKALDDFAAKAEYRMAHTYGLPAPPSVGDLELGVAAAERFLQKYPKHELAPQAMLEIAQSYYNMGRYTQAEQRLTAFLETAEFAKSKQIPEARQLLGQTLVAQKKFAEAIAAWKAFLDQHPTDPRWSSVQQTIVDTEFASADAAREDHKFDEARKQFETFLNKYPLDGRAPRILFLFGEMKFRTASEKFGERVKTAIDQGDSAQSVKADEDERKLFEEAIEDWRRVVSKYPGTAEASRAAFMIGRTLEERLGRLKEALEAYRIVAGNDESNAKSRIVNLTTPQLEIVTERKFRSDEKPRIKISTRNVEQVQVKVYRVDMTDYFRKMHLATGVESLDIALIDPDKQFAHKVDGYEAYLQIERDIEIPVEGPGVTAVTVASDKLEATTMVVVSDLDVVVKSSRNELFVYAQNMRTGKPIDGASLLVSDGGSIFAEEVTGKDGILQKGYEQLKSASDLRVFAVHEGHSASTVNRLEGLNFAVGLTPRGSLFTDRPAYRAGQLVNIKGIVRWVDRDQFTFKAGEKFKLDVYDARSRLIQSKDVALNGYGTIAGNVILPEAAPQGSYRVHLHQPNGTQSYETTFQVVEYQLTPVHATIDLPRKVYFRGEKVEGKVKLAYYYGAPVAGETLTYQLGDDGDVLTGVTNDQGEVAFSFETQRYAESTALNVRIQVPARNLNPVASVFLATRGFDVSVTSPRDVFINGETFDATFTVTDPAGEKVETKLKVEVYEQTLVHGKRGERLVESHEVTTSKDDGQAKQTLKLENGGRYIVRATGTDRFSQQVSGEKVVVISGEKDRVRLRILAEKHSFQVGDEAKVQVHWREAPALALVTYDGASILGYQLVQLQTGENVISIPMAPKLAPNFQLSIAVMERNRFHAAESYFNVSQRLKITLTPNKTTARPGDAIEVAITAVDSQGKPVAAELSLGLVQKNLLEMFADQQPQLATFFGNGTRTIALRQSTSCVFAYAPPTKGISADLLAYREAEVRRSLERTQVRELRERLSEEKTLSLQIRQSQSMDGAIAVPRLQASFVDDFIAFDADGEVAVDVAGVGVEYDFGSVQLGGMLSGSGSMAGNTSSIDRLAKMRRSGGFGADFEPLMELIQEETSGPVDEADKLSALRSHTVRNLSTFDAPAPASVEDETRTKSENFYNQLWSATESAGGDVRWSRAGVRNRWQYVPDAKTSGGAAMSFGLSTWEDNSNLSVRFGVEAKGKAVFYLNSLASQKDVSINGLTAGGRFLAINGVDGARLEKLYEAGLTLLPNMAGQETAFWDPAIVTDANGKASATITLPLRSTAFRLQAKGIDADSLAGQAEVEIVTKKELFSEIKLPLAFTTGDKAAIEVEVHNALEGARKIEVKLTATVEGKAAEQAQTVEVAGPAIRRLEFPVSLTGGDVAEFKVEVRSGEAADSTTDSIPILPHGLPVFGTASGVAAQSTITFVQIDPAMAAENPSLEILIGGSVNRSLLDAVLGGQAEILYRCGVPANGLERAASDILGGVALLEMIGATRQSDTPEAQALSGKISSAISQIVSAQQDAGGWSWGSRAADATPDRYLSSRIVWALASARKAGFAIPSDAVNKGVSYLQTAFSQASPSDRDGQAILLHGIAMAGSADFAFANRLHRDRNQLSAAALVHLALTFVELDRVAMAEELLRLADARIVGAPVANNRGAVASNVPWMRNDSELLAMYLLALQGLPPGQLQLEKHVETLLNSRVGVRWPVEKTNGPAVAALAKWYGKTQHTDEKYTLTVFVNDKQVEKITVDPSKDGARRLAVPKEHLVEGKPQRINFDLEGRGRFSYSAILSGFVPAERLKSTTNDWRVERRYEPAPLMLDGQPVGRGFSILTGAYTAFRNKLTQLPIGERGVVTLNTWRQNIRGAQDEQYDYLVVTEPLPAGVTVLTESITGGFERYELEPGRITFYVGDRQHPGTISFTVVGQIGGSYRAAPTVVRSFYEPQRIAVASAVTLDVLARGAKSADEYKLTPDEMYHIGQKLQAKGDHAGAHRHLTDLFTNYRLREETYKEVVQMLFRTSLAAGAHGDIVKFFEIIKEKYADIEVSFEDILKVAASYSELGEYERCYLVYRATIEASFQRESQVAGFLEDRGEILRSVQVVEKLLHDYPAESYIATATYALAQELYRKASLAAENQQLKDAGVTRVSMISAAIGMLDHFVTTWPKDPAADQASFALANGLLDIDQFDAALKRGERYAARYPESELLDSFWYIVGLCQFELGHPQEALDMCRKVAEAKFKDKATGGDRDARNKWEALYIMGQVYHSLGRAGDAIAEYSKVKDRFADAAEAIGYFSRKAISLDEVTTIKPTDDKVAKLKFRNIEEVALKVYRIDLMKFGLMQRNLDRITAINLAGIKPYHEETVKLGDGKDYKDREQELKLPLKEEGAYLVVARGGDLYASGLVLVSPLALEVQEDAGSGRVRVNVKDAMAEKYVDKVQVKVIGSSNSDFKTGETDLRGLFIADDVKGTSTIIAMNDANRYAFFRGKTALQPQPEAKPEAAENAPANPAPAQVDGSQLLRENLMNTNGVFQMEQKGNYDNFLRNDVRGIKAKQAY